MDNPLASVISAGRISSGSIRTTIVLVVVAVCSIGMRLQASAQMPASVVLDAATITEQEQMRRITGQVRAYQRARVASQEEGWVVSLDRRPGEAVEAGDVLARLDAARVELAVDRSHAALDGANAEQTERQIEADRAERELDRVKGLADQGIAGEQELDDARARAAAAQARLTRAVGDVTAARADVRLAERRLADMTIRAPFAGRIVAIDTEVGEWVDQGGTVAELVATNRIEVWADLPETLVPFVGSSARAVEINVPAARFTRATDEHTVLPAGDELSRIFPLRVLLDATDTALRPGMSADVFVPAGTSRPTLTVHKDAIRRDDAGLFVYFAVPYAPPPGMPPEMANAFQWQAAPARVERLFGVGERIAIRDGALPPGALVVTEGNERMFPTQPLIVLSGGPLQEASPTAEAADTPSSEGEG